MPAPPVPSALLELLATLRAAGRDAMLVGGGVRDRLRGVAPQDWDVATSAAGPDILALFPRAVPIGGAHGTVMVPTACGPVDVTAFRAATLEGDLGLRDFSINAIAWDPIDDRWWDPAHGRDDIEAEILRASGDPAERLAEDPLRALRAARLVAVLGFRPDPALLAALPGAREGLLALPAERVRAELDRLLEAPGCADGVLLLRATELEAALLPGAREDAPELLRALPVDRDLRLAAWLRDTRADSLLARWRFPKVRAREIVRILGAHPVDAQYRNEAGARRLRRRAGSEETLERMIALRRHELALSAEPTQRLDDLVAALARSEGGALQIADLAIDGHETARVLGVQPGPIVGRALRYLLEHVIDDPALNTRERLCAALADWRERDDPA